MEAIPLCLLEEHHEAFLLWNWAARTGRIAGRGNVLLHVDEHSDLRASGELAAGSAGELPLARIASLVSRRLDITNFIWPALRQGIFDRVCWLRWAHDSSLKAQFVPLGNAPAGGAWPQPAKPDARAAPGKWAEGFWLVPVRPVHVFTEPGPVALDIDLDFFLCDDAAGGRLQIEVTPEEYAAWRRDRYHKMRLLLGGRARMVRRSGRCWLRYATAAGKPGGAKAAQAQIHERIGALGNFLSSNRIRPRLIGICRSRHSGYTPPAWCPRIENELLELLNGLYCLEIFNSTGLRAAARAGGGLSTGNIGRKLPIIH